MTNLRALLQAYGVEQETDEEDLSLTAYFRRFVLTHQDRMSESDLAAKLGISRRALWERRLKHALPRPRGGS